MDYRTGKCSQCGAEYKVPASFAHSAARCKQCKGVVHLGPPQGATPAAEGAPAAAPVAMPAKKVVPKPAAPSAPRPALPEVAKGAPAAPSARPIAPKAEPTPAEKKGGTLERLRAERGGATPPPTAPTPAPSAPRQPVVNAPKPAAPSRAAAARSEGEQEERASSKRGARRGAKERPEKKKAPMGGILSAAGLAIVAVVLVFFRGTFFGSDTPAATEPAAVNAGAPASGAGTDAPKAPEGEAKAPDASDEPVVADVPSEAAPAKEGKKPAEPKVKDPASIDLAALADFGPTPDTSAEEWAQMQEWVVDWMDLTAGAAGNRAGLKLKEAKRKAVPVILNHFKKLDFSTTEGRKSGDLCQKALQDIWNGTNFDWRYADDAAGRPVTDPNDVWFCKRATELWCSLWRQAEANIEVWIQKAKLEEKDPDEAKRLREVFGKPGEASASGDDEDLEVD